MKVYSQNPTWHTTTYPAVNNLPAYLWPGNSGSLAPYTWVGVGTQFPMDMMHLHANPNPPFAAKQFPVLRMSVGDITSNTGQGQDPTPTMTNGIFGQLGVIVSSSTPYFMPPGYLTNALSANVGDLVLSHGPSSTNTITNSDIIIANKSEGKTVFTTTQGNLETERIVLRENGWVGFDIPPGKITTTNPPTITFVPSVPQSPVQFRDRTAFDFIGTGGSTFSLRQNYYTDPNNSNSNIRYTDGYYMGIDFDSKNGIMNFSGGAYGTAGSTITYEPNSRMMMDAQGSVVIGLDDFPNKPGATARYRLFVHGSLGVDSLLRAKEIRVNASNWPDYVFAKNYSLPALEEVSEFINANQHLPGIPPAAEVEKEGFSVSEMQAKLLLKVEELTLYMIELKKENTKLKEQMQTVMELNPTTR